MFNRKEFKQKSKTNLFKNYNSVIVISLLITLFTTGLFTSRSSIDSGDSGSQVVSSITTEQSILADNIKTFLDNNILNANQGALSTVIKFVENTFTSITNMINTILGSVFSQDTYSLVLSLLGLTLGIILGLFVKNILMVGQHRFFLENRLYHKTTISRIFYLYKNKKVLKPAIILMMKNIYLLLWAFTIIGLPIKYYSYRMLEFILAENPDIKIRDAFRLTNSLTKGYKWSLFIMDLSFLHWHIINSLTLNIAGVFYVNGYVKGTEAELYSFLRTTYLDNKGEKGELFNDVSLFNNVEEALNYPGSYLKKENKKINFNSEVKYSILNLILLFFIISFIGWVWEVTLHIVEYGTFVNRGSLHGFWLPIYGSGSILILILLNRFRSNPPLLFGLTMLLCGILEYFTSLFMELSTGLRWWDYSGYVLNINGRICLEGLLFFAIGGSLIVYFVAPFLDHQLNKIPTKFRIALAGILVSLFALDGIYSHFVPSVGEGITSSK